jgi:hypothetical protein
VIGRLVTAAVLVTGCRAEPRPAPPPTGDRTAAADPAPASSPAADRDRRDGGRTGETILGEEELALIPNLRLGTVSAAAGIDLQAVVNRLRAEVDHLRRCLRREVTPRPVGELTLTLRFQIDAAGQVARADLRGTEVVPLRRCITSSLVGTRGFPPRPAEVEATLLVSPVRPAGAGGAP